jgi:hypothetical protein
MGGYDYAGNDPVTREDPSGFKPADCDGSCMVDWEKGQATLYTSPPSPQAVRARAETAAYEDTQDAIAKLKAQIA